LVRLNYERINNFVLLSQNFLYRCFEKLSSNTVFAHSYFCSETDGRKNNPRTITEIGYCYFRQKRPHTDIICYANKIIAQLFEGLKDAVYISTPEGKVEHAYTGVTDIAGHIKKKCRRK